MVSEVTRYKKRRPGRKKEARNKNGRKRSEKIFALYAPWSLRWAMGSNGDQVEIGGQVEKISPG